jgi:hypothetical protein
VYPAGLKNGCEASIPSSMIPIFIPWPEVANVGPQTLGALISLTLRSSNGRYLTLGQTLATPGTDARRSACERGSTTEKPFATTVYRQAKRTPGTVDAIRDCSERWAEASVRTYERLAGARRLSRPSARVDESQRP